MLFNGHLAPRILIDHYSFAAWLFQSALSATGPKFLCSMNADKVGIRRSSLTAISQNAIAGRTPVYHS
jgi:hypothetical protein